MKKILIIGGNGFLGSYLAREFSQDYQVHVTVRKGSDTGRLSAFESEVKIHDPIEFSISEIITNNNFFAIINAAVDYGRNEESCLSVLKTNIELPLDALLAAVNSGCERFINSDSFFSKIRSNYPYLKHYRLSKKQLIDWLECFVQKITIINMQIEHMYGELDSNEKFIPSMLSKIVSDVDMIDLTPGEQERDFIHIKDVVKAFRTVVESPNIQKGKLHSFEVGTGISTSIQKALVLMQKASSSKTDLNFSTLPYRENELMHSQADTRGLESLGWKPDVSIEQGIDDLVKFYKSRVNNA